MRIRCRRRALGPRPAFLFMLACLALALSGCPQNEADRYLPASKIECDDNGHTVRAYRYEYDAHWRLVKEIITDGRDTVVAIITWDFDSDDHAVKTEQRPGTPGYGASSDVYFANGRIMSEVAGTTDGRKKSTVRTEYAYNAHGDLYRYTRTTHDEHGRPLEKYSEISDYEYTDWGRPSLKTVRMGESPSGAGSSRTKYTYNVDFFLVSEIRINEEGEPAVRVYFYDEHNRVTAIRDSHPVRHEYYEYFDRVQGPAASHASTASQPPALPLPGTVNDSDVLLFDANTPGAGDIGHLSRNERVSVLEISSRIESREGLRAPWLRIKTASGAEGWVFGYFIDTSIQMNILASGSELLDLDPPLKVRDEVYINRAQAPLFADLVTFTPAAFAATGERVKFLRQDNHLWQSGARYSRFLLVENQGKNYWISGNDVTAHYLPFKRGFFMSEERPALREINGREKLCLERDLFYTAENGVQNFLMPLAAFKTDESVSFTISSLKSEDVNGDGSDDIILRGREGRNRLSAEAGEFRVVERWFRLRQESLQLMFEKKITATNGSFTYRYEYEYQRDDRGLITAITETEKNTEGASPDSFTRYAWNGSQYEKTD